MNDLSVMHTTHLALSETRSRPERVGTHEGQGGSNAKVRSTLIYDADLRELPYARYKEKMEETQLLFKGTRRDRLDGCWSLFR